MSENRIAQTTVANAEEDARLPQTGPGAGGWVPASYMPLVLSILMGVLTSVGAVIALPGLTVPVLVGALIVGAGTGLSTFLGVKSAGPRKP